MKLKLKSEFVKIGTDYYCLKLLEKLRLFKDKKDGDENNVSYKVLALLSNRNSYFLLNEFDTRDKALEYMDSLFEQEVL